MKYQYPVKTRIQVLGGDSVLPQAKPVPKSVWGTAGILKDRYPDLKKHLRNIRKGWMIRQSS